MFQVYKIGSLLGAVIVSLNFFCHATPLINNCLNSGMIVYIFSTASDYPTQKRLFMKTKLAGLICLFVLSAQVHALASGSPAAINEKLIKAFQDAFPLAEKVDWKENGDHYFVHFKENDVLSEIEYDHEGNFIESERYYKAVTLLPIHLAWELHKKFPDKTVFGITETNTDAETYFYVKLEDNKEWITVKGSSDGIVQVVEKFNKQL
jgi:hypothetical protein